jgi:ankyrin repeat protein
MVIQIGRKFAACIVDCRIRAFVLCLCLALPFCGVRPVVATPTAKQSADQALVSALDAPYDDAPRATLAALARGANPNMVEQTSDQPVLMVACRDCCSWKVVSVLLQYGARANTRGKDGTTALLLLADDPDGVNDDANAVETARALLCHGADVHAANDAGQTVLHFVGNAALVGYLCSRGADINALDKHGRTPLICDCSSPAQDVGFPPLVWLSGARVLIEHGADVNLRDQRGWTALMCLGVVDSEARNDAMEIATLLVAHGAKIGMKDRNGRTACQIASEHGFRRLAAYLNKLVSRRSGTTRAGYVPTVRTATPLNG